MLKNVYDVAIIGAGPGGIFSAYQLSKNSTLSIAIIEKGNNLENRKCPIDGKKIKSCINCQICSIMCGFGGAGAFSDGKFMITNNFGGNLYEYIGKEETLKLMKQVDKINLSYTDYKPKLYNSDNSTFKRLCMQNNLNLLDSEIRHLGTDVNYIVLNNLYNELKNKVDFYFNTDVAHIYIKEIIKDDEMFIGDSNFIICTSKGWIHAKKVIVSVGRSGNRFIEDFCKQVDINSISNQVDIGVRVEFPYEIFSHITDELYESKIVYRTQKFEDEVRTFCMNPQGEVVNENTNGLITVNGHSFEDEKLKTKNTNFALLVSKTFTEPFNNSTEYGEAIVALSNMLGGGVIVQRFGDLVKGRRTNKERLEKSTTKPTLRATPGDLSLVLPKRILDDIIEMIYALDKIAPGTANPDTLLYGVEVKHYNNKIELNNNLESKYKGLYFIGDGSGVTHSLSHASASGLYVGSKILEEFKCR